MRLDIAMWGKALQIIPRLSKDDWGRLDVISRWLIVNATPVALGG